LSDPLASAYAHLYLARHGQALLPSDTGFAYNVPLTLWMFTLEILLKCVLL
jgi:hypothetical protein